MPSLLSPKKARSLGRVGFLAGVTVLAAFALGELGCNDTSSAPLAPGNVYVNSSMQDAVAYSTQDTGVVVAPQGAMDGGYADAYVDGGATGSTGYADVQSPQMACSSCACSNHRGFCLENGETKVAMGDAAPGQCPIAPVGTLSVGCNALPVKCAQDLTCQCLLDYVQPPLGCYPECTTSLGYFDIFCSHP